MSDPMQPTIGVAMIVKNEALTLPRLAATLRPLIDHWTIVDTGSSDATPDVVRTVFADLPGELIQDEWRGFGPSRNVALAAAVRATDWVLTVDADDVAVGTIDRAALDPQMDAWEAELRYGELRYWVPRLMRADAGWTWQGRAHEYLTIPGRPSRLGRLDSFAVEHQADGGNRGDKAERELGLLLEDWEEGVNPTRTSFYLARTFEDSGRIDEAVTWYRRRGEIGGWEEESWYARWRLGRCLLDRGAVDEGTGVLWSAWSARPHRAEPLCTLATHYRTTSQMEAAWQACAAAIRCCSVHPFRADDDAPAGGADRLFVHADVYDWRLAYEASIAAWYVGEHPLGRRCAEHVANHPDLPSHLVENVRANLGFYA